MKALMRAALLGALVSTAALAAQAQQSPLVVQQPASARQTFNLSAYGEVRVAPDMATINLGVTTEAPTAAQAMAQNATRMSQVIAALRAQGIAERDIQTSSLNLNPQYTYRDNQPPVLRGYQAQNQVTIRVMDIARLGQALDAVVAAGSNQINGIGFGLQNPAMAENQARREAVRMLQDKARLYAEATGMSLVGLVNLSEGGGYAPPPPVPMPMFARAEMAQADTQVQGGELAVRIDINGGFEVAGRGF